jgi:hypothetical protein
MNKYLLLLFVGLAVAVLIIFTNQQREGFRGIMDPCALQLSGLNQRVSNLANDAQDNTNAGVGAIQMITKA